jgi:catechol 2,3-dioxygenase-like lactoylglutathione lyase family enzyme
MVTEINAITLLVTDMARSLAFYESLGLELETVFGGPDQPFTSLRLGTGNFINLSANEGPPAGHWGRVIFYVPDPDAVHDAAITAGYQPEMAPSDAPWGERYFHLRDPDGHELSFARLL